MNVDGTDRTVLDVHPGTELSGPVRDGRAILVAESKGLYTLITVNVDGTEPEFLHTGGVVRAPVWSGGEVLFESDQSSFRDIYRVDGAGGLVRRVTRSASGAFEPSAADGVIAFAQSMRDTDSAELFVTTDETRRMTKDDAEHTRPRLSPDGKQLAWLSTRGDVAPHVWVMGVDGSEPRRVRTLPGRTLDLDMVWSPDGNMLAVVTQSGPEAIDLHLVDAASGETLVELDTGGVDEHPAFSPDGTQIALTSGKGHDTDVVVINRKGEVVHRIGGAWLPRWVR